MGILRTIENYIVRRFVCNVPTNQFNKIFPVLYSQAQLQAAPDFVIGVRRVMQARGYPKDAEFRQRLTEAKLYGGRRPVSARRS